MDMISPLQIRLRDYYASAEQLSVVDDVDQPDARSSTPHRVDIFQNPKSLSVDSGNSSDYMFLQVDLIRADCALRLRFAVRQTDRQHHENHYRNPSRFPDDSPPVDIRAPALVLVSGFFETSTIFASVASNMSPMALSWTTTTRSSLLHDLCSDLQGRLANELHLNPRATSQENPTVRRQVEAARHPQAITRP
jgi:hypothetical protein